MHIQAAVIYSTIIEMIILIAFPDLGKPRLSEKCIDIFF